MHRSIYVKGFALLFFQIYFFSLAALASPPRVAHKVEFNGRGSELLRFGDLNGDGVTEIVSAQVERRSITAIIAMDLEGRTLWQIGAPKLENFNLFSDLPIQLFDINDDGKDEVIFIRGGKLRIVDGLGKELASVKTKADDSIYINYFGPEKSLRILVKDRYQNFFVYTPKLKLLWKARGKTGHFPISFDRSKDGKPVVLVGYALYGVEGKELWNIRGKVKRHADGLFSGDMRGDGRKQIAIAASGDSVLVDEGGEILWRKRHKHSQHAVMGRFFPERPTELQAVFLDRGQDGTIFFYDYAGNELNRSGPHGRVTILSTVKGWDGGDGRDLLLAYRRSYGPPALMNGRSEIVATFPFPPARVNNDSDAFYSKHFVQHFDVFGDNREEMLVYNERELWIYENSAPYPHSNNLHSGDSFVTESLPNLRISNATFYTGEH